MRPCYLRGPASMRAGRSVRTGKPGGQRGASPGHGSVPGCHPASPPVTPAAAHPAALAGVCSAQTPSALKPRGYGGIPSPRGSRGSGGYRCHSGKSRWPNRSPSSAASQAGALPSFPPSIPIPGTVLPGQPRSGAGAAGCGSSRDGSGGTAALEGAWVGTGGEMRTARALPSRPVRCPAPRPPNAPPGWALTGQPPAAALRPGPRHVAAATGSGWGRAGPPGFSAGRPPPLTLPPPPPSAGARPWLRGGARRGRGGASAPGPAASRRRLPGFRPGAGLRESCGGEGRSGALAEGPRGRAASPCAVHALRGGSPPSRDQRRVPMQSRWCPRRVPAEGVCLPLLRSRPGRSSVSRRARLQVPCSAGALPPLGRGGQGWGGGLCVWASSTFCSGFFFVVVCWFVWGFWLVWGVFLLFFKYPHRGVETTARCVDGPWAPSSAPPGLE